MNDRPLPLGSAAVERRLWITRGSRRIPVALWTPADGIGRRPLVLVGHGGSGHKTSALVLDAALPWVTAHGFAVAALDGPVHGDRRARFDAGETVRAEFRELWAQGGSVEPMVDDWRATLDQLCRMPEVNPAAVGWYGVSMGTAYGLPFLAAERRVQAAVLGMWGTCRVNSARLVQDAAQVTLPVLFQQKLDDEFFTAGGQEEIFAALASPDKQLRTYPGRHTDPEGAQLDDLLQFLAAALTAAATRAGDSPHGG